MIQPVHHMGSNQNHIRQHTASCPDSQTAHSHSDWSAMTSPESAWFRPCCCIPSRGPRDERCWSRSTGHHPLRGRWHPGTAGACRAVPRARRRCSWEGRGTCTCSPAVIECACRGSGDGEGAISVAGVQPLKCIVHTGHLLLQYSGALVISTH